MIQKRKTPCLRPDALKQALNHERIWLRSEDIPPELHLKLYVDAGYIRKLENNSNHLVSGRRGTGKTHLLGAFSQHVNTKDDSSIAILISANSLTASFAEFSQNYLNQRGAYLVARDLFNQFLRLFVDKFLNSITLIAANKDQDIRARIDNALQDLLLEVEIGTYFFQIPKDKNSNNHNKKPWFGDDEVIVVDDKKKTLLENNPENSKRIDYYTIRRLIEKTLSLAEVSTMHLLIDEWMELDKNGPAGVQNEFSQLLKRVFFNSNRISVVIASIWNETDLYERTEMSRSSGIQVGHDIEHTVDLDTTFFEEEIEVMEFCKRLLFRRLSEKEPELNFFRRDRSIDDSFITDIFDSVENCRTFITASHGIPRELMKIFQKSAGRIHHDFKKYCIDHETINLVEKKHLSHRKA